MAAHWIHEWASSRGARNANGVIQQKATTPEQIAGAVAPLGGSGLNRGAKAQGK
jgi:hypothetical protein